ncbi:C-type lectin domain family 17, member A-like [Saccostrea cucullata]|uniref:C-type lectin domain family 17, member A-like n=1 Tax=Saccostrea cuccullata TaxID=36930 RepID=UPI002ED379FD
MSPKEKHDEIPPELEKFGKLSYFCTPLLPPFCQPGWVPFENHCYFLNKTEDTWENAKKHCEQNKAHLLEIETEIENTWARETFPYPKKHGRCTSMCACGSWIGANDIDKEGDFTWNGNTKTMYSNWHPSQPDNGRNGNCVQLCPSGLWDDTKCKKNKPFICEKDSVLRVPLALLKKSKWAVFSTTTDSGQSCKLTKDILMERQR